VVAAIRRDEVLVRDRLADYALQIGDEILALGSRDDLSHFAEEGDFTVAEVGLSAVAELQDSLSVIPVAAGSDLVGSSIAASRLSEVAGLTVVGLIRGDQTRLAVSPDERLRAGDQLLLTAESAQLSALSELGEVAIAPTASEATLETGELGMVEATVAPRSAADGRTLRELDFHQRYGLIALALWRGGQAVHTDLANKVLRFGDALLLHGPLERIRKLAHDSDFVVLSQADQAPRRRNKAIFALGGLLIMIGLVVTGYQPIHVAAFTAASLIILAGALTMREAYVAIEWRAIFLVAAVLPVGFAMERTGAAQFLADGVTSTAGPLGPHFVLAALIVLASLLSQGLDGAPAVVLMAPVVLEAAERLDISPYPLMMGVSLAASAAFMTPFSHKANLLVMGAGGYRSADYLRVGTPLTLMIFVLLVFLVPVFFPF